MASALAQRLAPARAPNSLPSSARALAAPAPAPGCRSPSDAETANSAGTRCRAPGPAPAAMGWPSIRICPRVGCSMPSSMRRNVVLPQPEAPTMVTNSWSATSRLQVLQHDMVAVGLPDIADRDAWPSARRLRPGKARARSSRSSQSMRHRQQRDPHHVRQDHVHRQVAAHQEDAVAQALGGGDGLGGDQEQPRRAQRSGAANRSVAAASAAAHPQHQLPGRGAQRLRLDQLFLGQLARSRSARSRAMQRARCR